MALEQDWCDPKGPQARWQGLMEPTPNRSSPEQTRIMKNPAKPLRARRDFNKINQLIDSIFTGFRQELEAKMDGKYENKVVDYAEQWIIQHRSAEPLHQSVWRSVSYVVSRDKLIKLSASLGLFSEPSKRAVLEALPSSATNLRK
jgi:hypothetical protein